MGFRSVNPLHCPDHFKFFNMFLVQGMPDSGCSCCIFEYLGAFGIDTLHGFLPSHEPLSRLPQEEFQSHENVAANLAELLNSTIARAKIEVLPVVSAQDTRSLLNEDPPSQRRALLLLSGLASAYVWGGGADVSPRNYLPPAIAVPLYEVSCMLETCPILSHQSNCLYNWKYSALEKEARESSCRSQYPGESLCGDESNEWILHAGEDTDRLAPCPACYSTMSTTPFLRTKELSLTFSFTEDENERMFYLLTLEIENIGARTLPLLEYTRRIAQKLTSSSESGAQRDECQHEEGQGRACSHVIASDKAMVAALKEVKRLIQLCQQVLLSMPRFVDPGFFYHRVRPYLSGWRNNPALPEGVMYRGVVPLKDRFLVGGAGTETSGSQTHGKRGEETSGYGAWDDPFPDELAEAKNNAGDSSGPTLFLSGASAAQSSLIPAIDVYLGVDHNAAGSPSQASYEYLKAMRAYMPKGHRRFLDTLEKDLTSCEGTPIASIREYIQRYGSDRETMNGPEREDRKEVREAYNGCVGALLAFRKSHLGIVHLYISSQQGQGEKGVGTAGLGGAAGGKGTGGQPPREFLMPLQQWTAASRLATH